MCLMFIAAPTTAAAAEVFNFTTGTPASGTNWSFNSGTGWLTVNAGANVVVTGTTANGGIFASGAGNRTITLRNVDITHSFDRPLNIFANTTIILEGTNFLRQTGTGMDRGSGIFVNTGQTLTINGDGALIANSVEGDGISNGNNATINVNGGTVIATGNSSHPSFNGIRNATGSTFNNIGGNVFANSVQNDGIITGNTIHTYRFTTHPNDESKFTGETATFSFEEQGNLAPT